MAITIKRFITCMTILLIVCIGCMYWIYYSQHTKIVRLEFERDILWNYRINAPMLKEQIVNLEYQNGRLKQDVSFYKGKYESGKLYNEVLQSRYLKCLSYANVAETILINNGINFVRLD